MRIGIVTVYNSLNCGSFLQAYALAEQLKMMGHKPCFLDTHSRFPFKVSVAKSIKCLRQLKLKDAAKAMKSGFAYRACVKKLDVVSESSKSDCDAFILGSDEIWNLHRSMMTAYPIFMGDGLPLEKTIAYSPSVNTATHEELKDNKYLANALKGLAAVSVRDGYSKEQIEMLTDREVKLCCDPTMLCDTSVYEPLIKDMHLSDYLFVYEYDRLSKDEIAFIKQVASENHLKTVAMGAAHKWADMTVETDPGKFLYLIKNAKMVISGTFHGSVFSVIYGTRLISLARSNRKIHELLRQFRLEDRIFTGNSSEDMARYALPMPVDEISRRIGEIRGESIQYIETSLLKVK